ncbi:hypothetical protein HH1059_11690 [Halorhodospira halochloris]|uniref:Uncharacterized protein n=1 Tax=Halorhodospira halochloris TaxID=1052 RepID=A0A2Z6EZJ6_HALHR|nr:hypothetical protein HH1059_11690 [Halorhodospira halochloris]
MPLAALLGASKNFPGATIRPGVEGAVNPSLEASWHHPWRHDLPTGTGGGAGEVFISTGNLIMAGI